MAKKWRSQKLRELYIRWGFDASLIPSEVYYHKFADKRLEAYAYQSKMTGYDSTGLEYYDSEVEKMNELGLIIATATILTVYFEEDESYFGLASESSDGIWTIQASNSYLSNFFSITGFVSEFYAVRCLHQLTKADCSKSLADVSLEISYECNDIDEWQEAIFDEHDLPLGYILERSDQPWAAASPYYPSHEMLFVYGFADESYVRRYLMQLASVYSFKEFERHIDDLWQMHNQIVIQQCGQAQTKG